MGSDRYIAREVNLMWETSNVCPGLGMLGAGGGRDRAPSVRGQSWQRGTHSAQPDCSTAGGNHEHAAVGSAQNEELLGARVLVADEVFCCRLEVVESHLPLGFDGCLAIETSKRKLNHWVGR